MRLPTSGIPLLVLILAAVTVVVVGLAGIFGTASVPAAGPVLPNPGPAVATPSVSSAQASGQPSTSATPARPYSSAPPAARLVWSDDFSGPAGSGPDGGKWVRDTGGSGFGNQELEYYTTSTRNAALDGNGHLVITARKENPAGYTCWYGDCRYTSARLNTSGRFSVRFGHIEAGVKLPRGPGIWPAFWALGNDIGTVGWPRCGEIDIMENVGREPGRNHGSLHGPGYSGRNALTGTYSLPGGQAFADRFHVFAVDWSPDLVTFSIDGNQYESRTPADTNGAPWVFDHSFFLVLNVAVGGLFPGSPDASTTFPQQMVVDYVRVYA